MKVEGFVLAGGLGKRMGVDKARVPFPERRPMAAYVADLLRPLCTRVRLVRRGVPEVLPWPGLEVVRDEAVEGDAHPLWGVAAALAACDADHALVLSCDRPWMQTRGLRRLCVDGGAVAVDSDGVVQPLVACLPVALAQVARAGAEAGNPARSLVDGLPRIPMPNDWLADVDRWEDTGQPGPLEVLRARLPDLSEDAWQVVARGEETRLGALGAVNPVQSPSRDKETL